MFSKARKELFFLFLRHLRAPQADQMDGRARRGTVRTPGRGVNEGGNTCDIPYRAMFSL
jgi:hypothetical protein